MEKKICLEAYHFLVKETQKLKAMFERAESESGISPDEARALEKEGKQIVENIHNLKEESGLLDALINHDLIGAIVGFRSQLWHFMKGLDTTIAIDSMRRDIWVMLHSVEAMKFFTENEIIQPRPIDIKNFLEKARNGLQMLLYQERDDTLKCEAVGDPQAIAHEGLLATILMNMARNAKMHGDAKNMLIRALSENDEVKIEICDDGSGIGYEITPQIFEFGYSGGESTGLGLAYAHEKMAAMGGTIACEPHGGIDGGAKFIISLQKARPQMAGL